MPRNGRDMTLARDFYARLSGDEIKAHVPVLGHHVTTVQPCLIFCASFTPSPTEDQLGGYHTV